MWCKININRIGWYYVDDNHGGHPNFPILACISICEISTYLLKNKRLLAVNWINTIFPDDPRSEPFAHCVCRQTVHINLYVRANFLISQELPREHRDGYCARNDSVDLVSFYFFVPPEMILLTSERKIRVILNIRSVLGFPFRTNSCFEYMYFSINSPYFLQTGPTSGQRVA